MMANLLLLWACLLCGLAAADLDGAGYERNDVEDPVDFWEGDILADNNSAPVDSPNTNESSGEGSPSDDPPQDPPEEAPEEGTESPDTPAPPTPAPPTPAPPTSIPGTPLPTQAEYLYVLVYNQRGCPEGSISDYVAVSALTPVAMCRRAEADPTGGGSWDPFFFSITGCSNGEGGAKTLAACIEAEVGTLVMHAAPPTVCLDVGPSVSVRLMGQCLEDTPVFKAVLVEVVSMALLRGSFRWLLAELLGVTSEHVVIIKAMWGKEVEAEEGGKTAVWFQVEQVASAEQTTVLVVWAVEMPRSALNLAFPTTNKVDLLANASSITLLRGDPESVTVVKTEEEKAPMWTFILVGALGFLAIVMVLALVYQLLPTVDQWEADKIERTRRTINFSNAKITEI